MISFTLLEPYGELKVIENDFNKANLDNSLEKTLELVKLIKNDKFKSRYSDF